MFTYVGFFPQKGQHCATLQLRPSVLACVLELAWVADQCHHHYFEEKKAEAHLPLKAKSSTYTCGWLRVTIWATLVLRHK